MELGVWTRPDCDTSACAEVMATRTRVAVRNSNNPDGPWVTFTHEEWEKFLDSAKKGTFDL